MFKTRDEDIYFNQKNSILIIKLNGGIIQLELIRKI